MLAYNFLGDGLRDALDPRLRSLKEYSTTWHSMNRSAPSASTTTATARSSTSRQASTTREFKLAREVDRVTSRKVEVTAEQEARVQQLLRRHAWSSRCTTTRSSCPKIRTQIFEYRRAGRDWTGYEGLAVSGIDAIFDCLMDGTARHHLQGRSGSGTTSSGTWACACATSPTRTWSSAPKPPTTSVRAKQNGQIAFIPSLEAATPIENEVDRLDILYGLGIRSSGIAYSEANTLGCGLRETERRRADRVRPRRRCERMNKLGIAIDISHSGDQTSLDTIEVSEKPIFITHAGARALWNTRRMKPDDVLKACADKGGVIGIEAAPHTTLTSEHPHHSIESFMQHFEYCVNLVGIDHVAFGPDTLFGDHVALHHAFARQLSISVRARHAGLRGGRVRRRHRKPGRGVPEHRPLAGQTRLLGRRHPGGAGRERHARAEGGLVPVEVRR